VQFYFMMNNELLSQHKAVDKTAFTHLFELYVEPLYLNLLKLVKTEQAGEKILQNIFLIVWKKKETITINHTIKGYLFGTAENKVHDFFRKQEPDRGTVSLGTGNIPWRNLTLQYFTCQMLLNGS
jgi:DNA-directed RNA polymerase specialized sigma24 family protein